MAKSDGIMNGIMNDIKNGIYKQWATSSNSFMRLAVANKLDLDIDTLCILVRDEDSMIRAAALNNPNCPEWLKVMMA